MSVHLGGIHYYMCRVGPDSPTFTDGSIGRIGFLCLIPIDASPEGIDVRWIGVRVASTFDGAKYIQAELPVTWGGRGHVALDDGRMSIEYVLTDRDGFCVATETVREGYEAGSWLGEFEGRRSDGAVVSGSVRHVRWSGAGQRPAEFDGLDISLRELIPAEGVGLWGEYVHSGLPQARRATESEPFVLIDVLSQETRRASRSDKIKANAELRAVNSEAVIYCAESDAPALRIGSGMRL